MRKTLVILFAVAILGGAGFYVKNQNSNTNSTATAMPSSASGSAASGSSNSKNYHDGTYEGDAAETPYGQVQISVVISGGKITDVNFLKMPDDEDRSRQITRDSEPQLKLAAITAQSSMIDFVTGATSTSYGYQESLQKALDQARLN